ncbi:MAG TPA: hypothetical protein VHK88_20155 [Aquihabitans sp.]|nr:hypothetical protein [Aquihabitans sp.]
MAEGLTPDQLVAQARIHDLLAELVDLIGPRFGGLAEDDLDPDEMPVGQVFLSEWVTVLAWVDEDGDGFTTRIGSPNLARHHRTGLLYDGLHDFD